MTDTKLVARGKWAVALVSASLLLGMLMPTNRALAGYTTCTSDPKVFLSNGIKVTMSATITDTAQNVTAVVYVLHGPVGTTVNNVVYTGGAFTGVESVIYSADEPAGSYDTSTVATTLNPADQVTAQTTVGSSTQGPTPVSGSATGLAGQSLLVHLAF